VSDVVVVHMARGDRPATALRLRCLSIRFGVGAAAAVVVVVVVSDDNGGE
jgi:hypothetical protein